MKPFKFIYASWKIHPKLSEIHTDWLLLVDTSARLEAFLFEREKNLVNSYMDLRNKEEKKKSEGGNYHERDQEQFSIGLSLSYADNRKNLADDVDFIRDHFLDSYLKFFKKEKKFVVYKNLIGFRGMDKSFKILKTVEKDDIIFPELTYKDIHISQWPGGKHFYARIGSLDVEDGSGKRKWNKEESAWNAAKAFLDKLNKKSSTEFK